VIGPGVAQEIVRTWLDTEFSQEQRHKNRIGKVASLEAKQSLHP